MTSNLAKKDIPKTASVAEVKAAIEALSEEDLYRLYRYANRIRRYPVIMATGMSSEDVLQEAFTRVLSGKRIWDQSAVPFVKYLMGVMKSMISHANDSENNRLQCVKEVQERTSLAHAITPEIILLATETLRSLERHFANDETALLYMMARGEGIPLNEVASHLSLSANEVEAARKRVERAKSQFWGEGESYDG